MAMTIDELAQEALSLPSETRALLADRLVAVTAAQQRPGFQSLDGTTCNRIDQLWISEAKRRRDEVRSGQVQTIPGDEGLARVRRAVGLE